MVYCFLLNNMQKYRLHIFDLMVETGLAVCPTKKTHKCKFMIETKMSSMTGLQGKWGPFSFILLGTQKSAENYKCIPHTLNISLLILDDTDHSF